jgi:hypothetical protein
VIVITAFAQPFRGEQVKDQQNQVQLVIFYVMSVMPISFA